MEFCFLYKSGCIPHAFNVLMSNDENVHGNETCNKKLPKIT